MERGLQPEQQPHRPGCHLGPDGQPVVGRLRNLRQQVAPRLGPLVALGQRDRQGAARALDQASDQGELGVGVGPEVRDQLHHAVPGVGHAEGDRLELVGPCAQRRRRVARRRPVVQRPRRREADGPGRQGLGGEPAHGGHVVPGRVLQAGSPLAHHVEPERAMGQLRAQIDVVVPALDRVEVLAEALPGPLDPLLEHGTGDVLDALHEGDQPVVRVGPYRREAHAAVAHHRRGDTVPAARRDTRVPRGLPVVVGVDVDEARRDEQAGGVDLLAPPPGHRADGGDHRPVDRNVRRHRLAAEAVGHLAAADHEVVRHLCHACPTPQPPRGRPGGYS